MPYQKYQYENVITPEMVHVFKKTILQHLNVTCDDHMVASLITDLQKEGFKLFKYEKNEQCSNLD